MRLEDHKPWAYVERVSWLFPHHCTICGREMKKGDEYVQIFCEDYKVITVCYECQNTLGDFRTKLKRLEI